MLKKRISASIIVRDGIAVQSFGFNKYLPIGDPLICAKNYDRWGADEILVTDISATLNNSGPDFDLISRIGNSNISTPLIYCGGIRSSSHASRILGFGFERIALTFYFLINLIHLTYHASLVLRR